MKEQSITLYAQWEADRHNWMILDDLDSHPLLRAGSADELMAAYERRQVEERQPAPA